MRRSKEFYGMLKVASIIYKARPDLSEMCIHRMHFLGSVAKLLRSRFIGMHQLADPETTTLPTEKRVKLSWEV